MDVNVIGFDVLLELVSEIRTYLAAILGVISMGVGVLFWFVVLLSLRSRDGL